MPDNNNNSSNDRKVEGNGVVTNQSSGDILASLGRLKIQDNQDQFSMAPLSPYPERPGEPNCVHYLRTGFCGYGINCRFNHPPYAALSAQFREQLPERNGQPDCGYYLKTGTCKYGSTCKYNHPRDRNGAGPVTFNTMGLPMRQGEKSCPHYMRTGFCKFGVACKFHHPQPMGPPVPGSAAIGSTGSSVVPSAGLSYMGYSSWSLLRATYPPVVLPTQGVVPAPQGWNNYVQGNVIPFSSSEILGSNFIYNSTNQGESAPSEQVHLISASTINLPERPDQPECRYFMNNGTCRYGSDCKYHHPKERIAQVTVNTGPLGLPLRPGQAPCSMYITYGSCNLGPNCRFDHPLTGYSYGYGLTLPPSVNSALMTYPTLSAAVTPLSLSHQSSDTTTRAVSNVPAEASSEPSRH